MQNNSVANVHFARNPQNNQYFDLILDRYNSEGLLRESLFIFEFRFSVGSQKIYRSDANDSNYVAGCHYYTLSDDGDVLCDAYNVSLSDTTLNHISITKINFAPRTVTGKFDVRVIIDRLPKCNATAKDTIVFANGSFLGTY